MIKAIISDFSRVLIFPKDETYLGSMNDLYREKIKLPEFNIFEHYQLNTELIEFYKSQAKFPVYIFTSGASLHLDSKVKPELDKVFKGIYSAAEIGAEKDQPKSYRLICKKLELNPADVLFVDDTQENILAAAKAGLQTLHYTNNADLIAFLNSN